MPTSTFFALPSRLHHKASPALLAEDEARFSALARALDERKEELDRRLAGLRRARGGHGEAALERDLAIHRLTAELRLLQRFGVEICLGRMVPADGSAPIWVGRRGLATPDGTQLLVDWRAPAAAPFFSATRADPQGLGSRRRYRWSGPHVVDYWDEALTEEALAEAAAAATAAAGANPVRHSGAFRPLALDEQSSFIESLGAARTPQMRDVLATLQADQDAIVRAPAAGPLVVDGGPGTGKTVVALHRAAHLLYSQPRLRSQGGVLVIGPHRAYLDYVADVLPSLGEDSVRLCTVTDLVPEGDAVTCAQAGSSALAEASARSCGSSPCEQPPVSVAQAAAAQHDASDEARRIKETADPETVLEAAVRIYEEPPEEELRVETPWADLVLRPAEWQEAFAAPEPGTSHNEAQLQVWEALVEILHDQLTGLGDVPIHHLRRALAQEEDLRTLFSRSWPLLCHQDIVADLWTVPDYARLCFPDLGRDQAEALRRADPRAWTAEDLPFLDAARRRIGDPSAPAHAARRAAARTAEAEERQGVAAHLIEADDSELQLMSMLRGPDLREALLEDEAAPDVAVGTTGAVVRGTASGRAVSGRAASAAGDARLDGPFAHIIVDEAQELTDAQWHMVLARCPSRSLTIVGDRAQARRGFAHSWEERLGRVGLDRVRRAGLSISYRTPAEVMAEAAPVIREVLPGIAVPRAVRRTGAPVVHGRVEDLERILAEWLRREPEGIACVIASEAVRGGAGAQLRAIREAGMPPEPATPHAADELAREAGEAAWEADEMTRRVRMLTPETAKGLEFDLVVLLAPNSWGEDVTAAVDRYVAMTRSTRGLALLE
ncbi:AAA family ATPase [Brevibacterium sp.]|uniref:HelD family protein n=1 Tax=Brevibacterium sp. TaxID=1701 RepID=UPI0025BBD870|nr:AAA family ATPase [Brevibacterium sp.]